MVSQARAKARIEAGGEGHVASRARRVHPPCLATRIIPNYGTSRLNNINDLAGRCLSFALRSSRVHGVKRASGPIGLRLCQAYGVYGGLRRRHEVTCRAEDPLRVALSPAGVGPGLE
jgi:hypothetical protein